MKLIAGTTPSSVNIPADPYIFAANKVQTATITVKFTKAGDTDGYNDPACATCIAWPPDAKTAMEHAAFIWANTITSDVDIVIVANWRPFTSTTALGQTYGYALVNFGTTSIPRYQDDTYFATALANKMIGNDLSPGYDDIFADFNSKRTDWFFGLYGGATNAEYDFVSSAVHEIAHGLGFNTTAKDADESCYT